MSPSLWSQLDMDTKVADILRVRANAPRHRFGRPFLTPYQIALAFQQQYPADFRTIGKPVGGKGTGQRNSVAQYIALELSKRIKSGAIRNIEGRFLYRANNPSLKYEKKVESSTGGSYDLSIFRLLV